MVMEEPLWTTAHQPEVEDFPQDDVRQHLRRATNSSLNLCIYGPPGSGKTAASRTIVNAIHDNPDSDVITINIEDFFGKTKKEIRDSPRFGRFLQGEIPWVKQLSTEKKQDLSKRYKSDWSKAEMFSHVMTELAANNPTSGDYTTIILDNAAGMRGDLQSSLRRTIERHYDTTQFIFVTRTVGDIIPAIKSRCLLIPVRRPSDGEVIRTLREIASKEGVETEREGLEAIAEFAEGNIRKSILTLQTVATRAEAVTEDSVEEHLSEVEFATEARDALDEAERGNLGDARSHVTDLIDETGGNETFRLILDEAHDRYDGEVLVDLMDEAAAANMNLAEGNSPRIHVMRLLSHISERV